jgi:hypothetical protein
MASKILCRASPARATRRRRIEALDAPSLHPHDAIDQHGVNVARARLQEQVVAGVARRAAEPVLAHQGASARLPTVVDPMCEAMLSTPAASIVAMRRRSRGRSSGKPCAGTGRRADTGPLARATEPSI